MPDAMKLECLQENLAEGLAVVGRVVPAKSTLPVLSNVLLSTRDTELQLTANNLDLSTTAPAFVGLSRFPGSRGRVAFAGQEFAIGSDAPTRAGEIR